VPRAPLRLVPCLVAVLACAGAPPTLPAGVSATPAVGDSLALLVTKLHHAEGAPADVAVRELRLLSIDREPWSSVDLAAGEALPGDVGVIAGRRCHSREGLTTREVERGSWYLLRAGALFAFDHWGFGANCADLPLFAPAAASQVGLERSLMRYLSQRWPVVEIPGEQRLARGLALLAQGRSEDAAYELYALDRHIAELERRQSDYETPDAGERERLQQQEEQLRPLRAQLLHALRDQASQEVVLP